MNYLHCFWVGVLLACESSRAALGVESQQPVTGGDLYKDCRTLNSEEPDQFARMIYCFGYIEGAASAVGFYDATLDAKQVCVPKSTTREQIIDVVRGFLAQNPDAMKASGSQVVFAALVTAFPCSPTGD
jgi:hypothetical protein